LLWALHIVIKRQFFFTFIGDSSECTYLSLTVPFEHRILVMGVNLQCLAFTTKMTLMPHNTKWCSLQSRSSVILTQQ